MEWTLTKVAFYKNNERRYYVNLEQIPLGGKGVANNFYNWKESKGKTIWLKEEIMASNKVTIFECQIIDWFMENNCSKIVLKNVEDGFVFQPLSPSGLTKQGTGGLFNLVRYKSPHIIKYLKDKTLADKNSYKANIKVECCCPNCNYETETTFLSLTTYGYQCYCKTGKSYSERVLAFILNKLEISYEREKKFIWSEGRRYDFYDKRINLIIELHGEQHYRDTSWYSAKEISKIDQQKENNALGNGVEFYYQIDCRYSTLEWCRPNLEKVLCLHYDTAKLTEEDWISADVEANSFSKMDIIEYWNDCDNQSTTGDLANHFNMNFNTIARILKWGNERGLCVYHPETEKKKSLAKAHDLVKVKLYHYDSEHNLIAEYPSIAEAKRVTKISKIYEYLKSGKQVGMDSHCTTPKYDIKYRGSYFSKTPINKEEMGLTIKVQG